ncbi:hypothetical protein EMIHUDRAFT_463031 [Emiliania huxleyi CCMP1516]|uniref:Uncharacterized protein n=2 Tax=Emiliania huxleyi TaxID=2903 RepID=A0A0D3K0S5_EMIH1|nr:hypothetical protein EMIHUDRAFT_463031 [Emiliania huxleyi CCMP1516]EOD29360.1 hypothetical protein EMIHUDRAFT_463031 [Emiliania huxleyi CCMP1516]|eukprot:XP_005781789.1 hypothetical protein EMIHUDRAFT_463031 [Emiliania huxleyi CCMP1516]
MLAPPLATRIGCRHRAPPPIQLYDRHHPLLLFLLFLLREVGDAFLVGVRASTGTVDAVSPASHPSFSYTMPLKDASVKLHWADSGRAILARDGLSSSVDASRCLTPPLPFGRGLALRREVRVAGAEATLSLTITNSDPTSGVEIGPRLPPGGGLGLSVPFNQMFTGRSLPQVAQRCSFTEVYLGGEAGYVQVLLVLPLRRDRREDVGAEGRSASGWRGFEGWRPLKQEDRANYDWMHEMLYEVVVHSEAYARAEWRGAAPWAPPSSATLPPGGSATYGLRMILARDVESVGEALLAAGVPVATPLPAATLHADMTDARLHLSTPKGLEVVGSPRSDPPGCLEAAPLSGGTAAAHALRLRPVAVGRCRLTLRYRWGPAADRRGELLQFVHYNLLEPAAALLQRHGDFASTVGWLPGNGSDPWHRGPGYMGTDADADGGRGGALLYDPRVFMAGHSDESGASAPLAMSVKQLGLPSDAEVGKLEEYVHETLWAGASGRRSSFLQGADHSVRLSMLYWNDAMDKDPSGPARRALPALYDHCHKCWASCKKGRDCCYWMHCWSEEHSLETWRAYNYPHVTVGYWSLYRVARHISPPPTKRAGWRWYLEQAGRTAVAMHTFGGRGTSQWGLMVGSIFVAVLADLRREGLTALADELEAIKERRMRKWMSMLFPYGSEFPWDSTGHEEIHSWLLHDGKVADANKTVQAVLAYSTVVPHWAYCGSARRYWDFTINGKTQWGNEREFHHYGPGVYGYWRSAAAYVACMPPFGWSCFLCDLAVEGEAGGGAASASAAKACDAGANLRVTPRDAFGRRAYLAPLGLTVTVEGGRLVEVELQPRGRRAVLRVAVHERARSSEASVFLEVERRDGRAPAPTSAYSCAYDEAAYPCSGRKAGAFVVPLRVGEPTRVILQASASGSAPAS